MRSNSAGGSGTNEISLVKGVTVGFVLNEPNAPSPDATASPMDTLIVETGENDTDEESPRGNRAEADGFSGQTKETQKGSYPLMPGL